MGKAEPQKKADSKKDGDQAGNFDQLRSRIKQSMEDMEEKRRVELLRTRIDIASTGIREYEKGNYVEAINSFVSYLKIVEDWKGVSEGNLSPKVFDKKEEASEILLVAGVYWDLAKLYDRSDDPKILRQFREFISKYVLFSKGMDFQPLSAESIRKYIVCNRPVHKKEFAVAYAKLKDKDCFIASVLSEELHYLTEPRLRGFRDVVLVRSFLGRVLIKFYYSVGPWLARWTRGLPDSWKRFLASFLDRVARILPSQ